MNSPIPACANSCSFRIHRNVKTNKRLFYDIQPDRAPRDGDRWSHDRYEGRERRGGGGGERTFADRIGGGERRDRDAPARLRVSNIHYDLNQDDLTQLFSRIAPPILVRLTYDNAGRSTGIAYVVYESIADARDAIRQFDGQKAAGQPLAISMDGSGVPSGRGRSRSPPRRGHGDSYRPGAGDRAPSAPRGRGRGRGASGRGRERGERREVRPAKTQDDLDRELEEYLNGRGHGEGGKAAADGGTNNVEAALDLDEIMATDNI
ncbi:RNA-binding domain-containing protein [Saitoella complicata NRRL Y-17804]|uniref:RNA-binding domain-containing protein n=1 Tax=Saitoella complicata (strain BCRC 22490 / CBS 7301 / JCM 7358 / NBRC 10748 / NRRL Y-17804) TaxID=698492 RepID=UPI000867ADBE|nr:RNA-binding domain-containing protein [Saitoella complicata NRRL Y-17804]ODQ55028.1 RNA-binding domain-containing protein [Saitoella complicata NRRL Y-17804]